MKVTISNNGVFEKEYNIPDESPKAKEILNYFQDKQEMYKAAKEGKLDEYYERTGKKQINALQLLFGRRK